MKGTSWFAISYKEKSEPSDRACYGKFLKGNSGVKMNLFQRNGQLVRVPFSLPVLSSGLSSGICFG